MVDVTAIVPLKAIPTAKGRLADVLAPADRRSLAIALARRVLDACLAARHVSDVVFVPGDAEAARAAGTRPVRLLWPERAGLSAAVAGADAAAHGAAASVVLPGDLALVTPDDVDAACVAVIDGDAVVAVAATEDGGTGALVRRPPDVMSAHFGPDSAAVHLAVARAHGLAATALHLPGLALDVDTPAQLVAAARRDPRWQRWATAMEAASHPG